MDKLGGMEKEHTKYILKKKTLCKKLAPETLLFCTCDNETNALEDEPQ